MERVATMEKMTAKGIIQGFAEQAGVTINGNQPGDIQIHNENLYARILNEGTLGFGEAYMDNWWDCDRLDILFEKILLSKLHQKIQIPLLIRLKQFLANFINLQTKKRALRVAHTHYNLGNDLFTAMLDPRMIYSCGYWKDAKTLEEAQLAKLELVCQKLYLKPGLRILDIGCGWGGFAKYAAEKYDVTVVGITISQQQFDFAKENCKGLPVSIRLQDYRDINETFDRIVSIGMFEHVGHLNYKRYMQAADKMLANNGLFLLHTIGTNLSSTLTDEWIHRYIFPNGMIPSITKIGKASESFFVMEDWQNFGAYYDSTLMAWHANFLQHWEQLKSYYDERFFRMWTYYLLSSAGSFRARANQLWQIVFSKGIKEGYMAPR